MSNELRVPPHPFWCEHCGAHAAFRIGGCPIPHAPDCVRAGEDAQEVYAQAVAYVVRTGEAIP